MPDLQFILAVIQQKHLVKSQERVIIWQFLTWKHRPLTKSASFVVFLLKCFLVIKEKHWEKMIFAVNCHCDSLTH